jgi:hypothetical protein
MADFDFIYPKKSWYEIPPKFKKAYFRLLNGLYQGELKFK